LYLQQKASNKPAPADTQLENNRVETSNNDLFYSNSSENANEMLENSSQTFQQQQEKRENSVNFAPNKQFSTISTPNKKLLEIQQNKPNNELEVQHLQLEKLEIKTNTQVPTKTLEIFGSYLDNPPVGAVELSKQASYQLTDDQIATAENLKFQNYQGVLDGIKNVRSKISIYKARQADDSKLQKELSRLMALKNAYIANQLKPNKKQGGEND
jgi:hypothetical protein